MLLVKAGVIGRNDTVRQDYPLNPFPLTVIPWEKW